MKQNTQNKPKPTLYDLNPFHLYLPALVSILHRLSGILVFFTIPLFLWILETSLSSAQQFEQLKSTMNGPGLKIFLWLVLSALAYHWFAGIRHILMDMHIGETKQGGRLGAGIVLIVSILFALGMGLALMGDTL